MQSPTLAETASLLRAYAAIAATIAITTTSTPSVMSPLRLSDTFSSRGDVRRPGSRGRRLTLLSLGGAFHAVPSRATSIGHTVGLATSDRRVCAENGAGVAPAGRVG